MSFAHTSEAAREEQPQAATVPALAVSGLSIRFRSRFGEVAAASDVSFSLARGELLALLGESGSGKSVTARATMGLLTGPNVAVRAERIALAGQDVGALDEEGWRAVRGRRIAMVFQDAMSALNPVLSIGDQLGETFRIHEGSTARAAREKSIELLRLVRIPAPERRIDDYPHQFSGGMRQRILIAMAIALRPDVLIADEPTTALDVTVQAQILELLDDLRRSLGMAVLLITHDLGVVAKVADRAVVMYGGRIVETAPVVDLFARPAHPYTEGLLASIPGVSESEDLVAIPGSPPNLARLPPGCAFEPRCHRRVARCAMERPLLKPRGLERSAACCVTEPEARA
ncbi:ABC transporter ATP-binding protein [Terrarubrum flagellatum]|uniref:ABC transporter ATP-binding protein n=1 Tax=Terrirubrum flagellatum TaxID=2895980 RepID=UPI0031454971